MGTSPNLCIQLNINLVKCRLKNTCISYVWCDAVLVGFCVVGAGFIAVTSRLSDYSLGFLSVLLLLLFFGCYCLRGNSLFDEIFRNIKMRQHSARNQNQQKNTRKNERYDNNGNNVTVLLFPATAVERFYILTFQWLVCFRCVRIRTL